jgi:hypothetical protein
MGGLAAVNQVVTFFFIFRMDIGFFFVGFTLELVSDV